ncbi:MAG: hypothetical protein CML24_10780 [Rhizobiales bacterium]|nr:hypothetical protein [Hyphomicrobiales bacterium]|tara:strand:- start:2689 stop:2991 length:303 start_codon:yes stop_codon:yes gene_type:complete
MLTDKDIKYIDECAERCRYKSPPAELEPTGVMFEDPKWEELSDWFEIHTHSWPTAMQVYIARRWGQSIGEVYANTDNWMKGELRRKDIRDDPEAADSYGN